MSVAVLASLSKDGLAGDQRCKLHHRYRGANNELLYPISETQRLGFSFGLTDTEITSGRYAVQEIRTSPRLDPAIEQFYVSTLQPDGTYSGPEVLPYQRTACYRLADIASDGFLDVNGDSFTNLSITGSWQQSTLNWRVLATRGMSNALSAQISIPGSDLEFYKLNYRGDYYFPIVGEFVFHLRGELGYGDGYGETSELPFYEHFFAGGFGSVRGFETCTPVREVRHPFYTKPVERSLVSMKTECRLKLAAKTVGALVM